MKKNKPAPRMMTPIPPMSAAELLVRQFQKKAAPGPVAVDIPSGVVMLTVVPSREWKPTRVQLDGDVAPVDGMALSFGGEWIFVTQKGDAWFMRCPALGVSHDLPIAAKNLEDAKGESVQWVRAQLKHLLSNLDGVTA